MVIKSKKSNRSTASAVAARTPSEAPVFLVFGDDEFVVSSRAREIVNTICPESERALGLEIIDGRADNQEEAVRAVSQCFDALNTVGFFGGGKTVWLRDVTFLGPGVIASATKEAVARLAERIKSGLGEGNRLVIEAEAVDKRSALFKACDGIGHVEEHQVPERTDEADASARERARALFQEAQIAVTPAVIEQFIQKTGPDLRSIRQEVEKLALYVGDRKAVTPDDVRDLASSSRESPAWELNEAIGRCRLNEALMILRRLLFQKEAPIGLIIQMENHFQLLLLLKNSQARGWLSVEGSDRYHRAVWRKGTEVDRVCGAFGRDPRKMHPYRTLMLLEQAAQFSLKDLMKILDEIVRTHEMMVHSGIPQKLLLEMLVVRITGPKQKRRKQ